MKNKLLHQLWMYSKNFIYGFLIQCMAFTTLMANDGNAQLKSIDEVFIAISFDRSPLVHVFQVLERETGFNLVYSNKEFNQDIQVNIPEKHQSVSDLLTIIAQLTGLQLKQVNNNINIKKSKSNKVRPVEARAGERAVFITVKGTVTSADDGTTLPGVNVTVKGTAIGTVTDIEGN